MRDSTTSYFCVDAVMMSVMNVKGVEGGDVDVDRRSFGVWLLCSGGLQHVLQSLETDATEIYIWPHLIKP